MSEIRNANDPSRFLLAWSGYFLSDDPDHDWIGLLTPKRGWAADSLLSVVPNSPTSGHSYRLDRPRNAPRALPEISIAPAGEMTFYLKATKLQPLEGNADHYFCADPINKRIEINRQHANEWEQFMLLSRHEVQWLDRVIERGSMLEKNGEKCPVEIDGNFALRAGSARFDLQRIFGIPALPLPEPGETIHMFDTEGRLCRIEIDNQVTPVLPTNH